MSHIVQSETQRGQPRARIVGVGHEYFRHQGDVDKRRHGIAVRIVMANPPGTGHAGLTHMRLTQGIDHGIHLSTAEGIGQTLIVPRQQRQAAQIDAPAAAGFHQLRQQGLDLAQQRRHVAGVGGDARRFDAHADAVKAVHVRHLCISSRARSQARGIAAAAAGVGASAQSRYSG